MTQQNFGQLLDWNDTDEKKTTREDWLDMKQDGSYQVRFLMEPPFSQNVHWIEIPETGKKIKVNCAAKNCIACADGVEVQKNYLAPVYNRDLDRPQILTFRKQVFGQIREYRGNKAWGSILDYDFTITKKLSKKPMVYSSIACPKEPLSNAEQAKAKEFMERIDLNTVCAPSTNEEISRRINEARNGGGAPQQRAQVRQPAATVAPADDMDFTFSDD